MSRTAERFVEEFYNSFTSEMLAADEPAEVVDRYYAADVLQVADGIEIDRDKLIAHLRPVRKNLVSWRYEVHEALLEREKLAARFTIHAQLRKGRMVSTEVYLFGELTPDGRLRRSTQLTRDVTPEAVAG
ncbi:nuclear transport factor 2 family protein [Kribbella sp. NPDC023855]|uniref:nuclear transport factor 2 family protein n=1 Tax=Kribbella sp. NPDC023855 TaxID=3154698 RepID=UPI00341044A4